MAIKTKPDNPSTSSPRETEAPLQFKNNPEVERRLNVYKEANPTNVHYYDRVVREAPERARDMLLYKDMQKHESEMRLVQKQLPQAQAFYEAQPPEVRARIDERLENVRPLYRDKAFIGEVVREMTRRSRQLLTAPGAGMSMTSG